MVMVLMGVLFYGGGLAVKEIDKRRKYVETQQYMQEVREAILLYASKKRIMPHPEPTATGLSDTPTGIGVPGTRTGVIPYKTLNVKPTDASGNKVFYYLTKEVGNSNPEKPICQYGTPSSPGSGGEFYRLIFDWLALSSSIIVRDQELSPDMSLYRKNSAFVLASPGPNRRWDKLGVHNRDIDGFPILKANKQAGFDDLVLTTDAATVWRAGCLSF